jgi:HEAT repeat protein
MAAALDFAKYLRSVVDHPYGKGERQYVVTDAIGQEKPKPESAPMDWDMPFQFELMAQTVEREEQREPRGQEEQEEQKEQKKIERFPVLEGIRKYAAGHGHVLLSGRPGSGKSTALIRLLLEDADSLYGRIAIRPYPAPDHRPPIPILLELRLWENSILDRILKTLHKHDPNLAIDHSTLMDLLRQGRFLLLMDGLNELPSEAARQDVIRFRADYPKTPMIFTTRELSAGGDFGITKKLEMQPLTETQMRQFVRTYLGEAQGEQLLKQLKERLRELGQTPLLLWMLCCLFQQTGTIPPNLGLVFRQFTGGYDKLKRDIPAREESRRWWEMLLQRLAFAMMQGDDPQNRPTEFRVAIPRAEAQQIFEAALQIKVADPGDRSIECLNDLLKHHLIQENGNSIEFRHQLLQEYYAAEALLPLLPSLSDAKLKRNYLNYLKWTEPIALMLALVEQETEALRVVRSALDVDLMLGARLAGAVKPAFQEQTIGLIEALDVPMALKMKLLKETRSDVAVPRLVEAIDNSDYWVRLSAAEALGNIGSEAAIPVLLKAIEDSSCLVRWSAIEALGNIRSETAIPALLKAIEDSDDGVRQKAAKALGNIGSDAAIPALLKAIEDSDYGVGQSAAEALGNIGSEAAIPALLKVIKNPNSDVHMWAAEALGNIGSDAAIPALLKEIEYSNYFSSYSVRQKAAKALGNIGSEAAIPALLKAIKNPFPDVRHMAAEVLGNIGSEATIPALLKAIEDSDCLVRWSAIEALGNIRSETAIPALLKAIEDSDDRVRHMAAKALGNIGSEAAIPALLKAIEDSDSEVRWNAAEALGNIGSEAAIPALLKAIEDSNDWVRQNAAKALGNIGSEAAIPALLKAIHSDYGVRQNAIEALGNIGSEAAIPALLKAIHSDYGMRQNTVKALGTIGCPQSLKLFWQKQLDSPYYPIAQAITAIQNRCKFYNYELFQSEAIQESPPQEKSSITMNFYAPVDVATGNVEGNFINSAGQDPDQEVNP